MNDLIENNFFVSIDNVDKKLSSPPTEESVNFIINIIKSPVVAKYVFLSNLSVAWFKALIDKDVFANPPSENEENLRYWVQVNPLLNFAEKETDLVFNIFKNIIEIKNYDVRLSLIDVLKYFSDEQIKEILPNIVSWFENDKDQKLDMLAGRACRLANILSERNYINEATSIYMAVLSVKVGKSIFSIEDAQHTISDVSPKINLWNYKKILETEFEDFFNANKLIGMRILINVLDSAVAFKASDKADDYSKIWCKSINKASLTSYSFEETLVAACRIYYLKTIADDLSLSTEILKILESKKWSIFKRLYLNFLSKNVEFHLSLINRAISITTNYDNYYLSDDYKKLLQKSFPLLNEDVKSSVLNYIASGPKLSAILDDEINPDPDDLYYEPIRTADWYVEKIKPIKEYLDDDALKPYSKYYKVIEDFNIKHPPRESGIRILGNNKLRLEFFERSNTKEIIFALRKEITDKNDPWDSSLLGSSNSFESFISKYPIKALDFIDFAINESVVFSTSIVNALKSSKEVVPKEVWEIFLKKLLFVFSSLKNEEDEKVDTRYNIRGLKLSFAWTLESSLAKKESEIYLINNELILESIKILCNDIDPTVEYESKYSDNRHGVPGLSLNSIRPLGLHCLIQYSLTQSQLNTSWVMSDSLIAILDKAVDRNLEKSDSVRSVIGKYLPWIILLNKKWVLSNMNKISPPNPLEDMVILKSYLALCGPYNDTWASMKDAYSSLVNVVNNVWEEDEGEADFDLKVKLGEHLVIFYLRDKIKIEDDLFVKYFEKSSMTVKKKLFKSLGHSIKSSGDSLGKSHRNRLMLLLDNRAQANIQELEGFSWYFSNRSLDIVWRIGLLKKVLKAKLKIDAAFFVFDELEYIYKDFPVDVVECLDLFLDMKNNDPLMGEDKRIKNILESILKKNDEKSIKAIISTISHKMGSKGFLEFRKLSEIN